MPAVSKAQQRFMGMVHAADKGETPASPEVAKVSASMKDSDAKDFASTKHKGLPDHVKEAVKEIVRDVLRAEGAFGSVGGGAEDARNLTEMGPNDVHLKTILKLYDRGGSFTKKKVGVVVSRNPKASRNQIIDALRDMDYHEILDAEDELGIKEIVEKKLNEGFKHFIQVDTPTQVISKPVAAQILALAKKGVKAAEIGLKMGFVGNQKLATDAFQKVKNQIYFSLHKNESINELTQNEKRIKEGNPNNVFYVFYKGKFEAVYWAMNSSDLFKIYWDQFKVRKPAGSQFKLNPEFIIVSKKEYDTSTSNRYAKLKPYVDKFWDKLQNESVNEGISKDAIVRTLTSDKNAYFLTKDGNGWILDITPKGAQHSTFHQKFTVKDMGKGHLGMKYKLTESHDCGCNENHDCGCGGLHEHHINEDINADANGIAGLTTSRANAVKDFIEKHKLDSNKLYQFLKKGGLKDKMDFVTALVGKPGNPIQTKLIKQFSK